MPIFTAVLFLLLSFPAGLLAQEATSVSPSAVSPGVQVTVTGEGFTSRTQVALGDRIISPETVSEKRLTFTVPPLEQGDYILRLVSEEGTARTPFLLRLAPPKPVIDEITPGSIDTCSLQSGQVVQVTGRFLPGTRMTVDGTVVPAEIDPNSAVFTISALQGGLHQIQAIGPDRQTSLPHPLAVSSVPRILSVQQGENNVTSYEVLITGENFLYDSTLVVNDAPINAVVFIEGGPARPLAQIVPRAESVRYVDCNNLVYIRRPVTEEPKLLRLQVVNPGGEQSPVYEVTLP